MKNNVHFYVEPKNGFVLLMTLLLSASAISRVLLFSMNAIPGNVWWRVVLPVAATALYILIALCQGREQFYKTAIPVWLLALFAAIWVKESLAPGPLSGCCGSACSSSPFSIWMWSPDSGSTGCGFCSLLCCCR